MTGPSLESVTITDFRSISGSVTIPLNAPIVLIHGSNGAGKSSVLSALELALTGRVDTLARAETNYMQHLVHRGSAQAVVRLTLESADGTMATNSVVVNKDGTVDGHAALSSDDQRTYLERCYLAQSTLSGLLELYQRGDEGESPLTRFVKDLLGLDKLEALIDGLFPVGHVQRLRRLVPELGDAEHAQASLRKEIAKTLKNLASLAEEREDLRARLVAALTEIRPGALVSDLSAEQLLVIDAGPVPEVGVLDQLNAARQELAGLRRRFLTLTPSELSAISLTEVRWQGAHAALNRWQDGAGGRLNALIDESRQRFADLPTVATASPTKALEASSSRVLHELSRFKQVLAADSDLLK